MSPRRSLEPEARVQRILAACIAVVCAGCDATADVPVPRPSQPRIFTPDDGSILGDATPEVQGEARGDVRIELIDAKGRVLGSAQVESSEWSITTIELADGRHELTAVAIAGKDTRSDPSDPVTITVDTEAPAPPTLTAPAEGSLLTKSVAEVEGQAEPDSAVELLVDGAVRAEEHSAADGRFGAHPLLLQDGELELTAIAIDSAGNRSSPSAPVHVVLDRKAPDAPVITQPDNGAALTDGRVEIEGMAEPRALVAISDLDDGSYLGETPVDADGRFQLKAELAEGAHALRAVATDVAGNKSAMSMQVSFSVDMTAPDAPVLTAPAAGRVLSEAPLVTGTAEAGTVVSLLVDGEAFAQRTVFSAGTFSARLEGLAEGEHEIVAVAADKAGNQSSPSQSVVVTLDFTPPAAPVFTLGSRTTNVLGVQAIEGSAEPGSTVELFEGLSVGGGLLGSAELGADGAFAFQTFALGEGAHRFSVVVTDAAGLSKSAAVTIVVDTQPPAPPIINGTVSGNYAVVSPFSVSGTVEDAVRVDVSVEDQALEAELVTSAYWRVSIGGLSEGSHEITATATDAAGNTSAPSTPFEVTLDMTAPIVSASDVISNTGVVLDATISDLTPVTISWFQRSGPGTITFDDKTIEDPSISADAPGDYTLGLDVTDAVGRTTYTQVKYTLDTTAPTVVLRSPDVDETGVGVERSVRAQLSEPIDPASLAGNFTLDGGSVAASTDVALGGYVIVLTPTASLGADTVHQVDLLAGITDMAGNPIEPLSWSFTTVEAGTPSVLPLYANGSDWNDYVVDDGADALHALDTACDAGLQTDYFDCLHGAVLRKIDTGDASCSGHTASDALDAFDWVCDDSSGTALMITTGLKQGRHLSDLLDFELMDWKPNAVTVSGAPGPGYPFTTGSAMFWGNPVFEAPLDGALDTTGGVYLVRESVYRVNVIEADRVALVVRPGEASLARDNRTLLASSAHDFLWIEGLFLGAYAGPVLHLSGIRMSVLDDVQAWSGTVNLWLDGGASKNLLRDVHMEYGARGLVLTDAHDNHIAGLEVERNGDGLLLEQGSSGNHISELHAARNDPAVLFDSAPDNEIVSGIVVRNRGDGVTVRSGRGNRLAELRVVGSSGAGVVIEGAPDTRLSAIVSNNNVGAGLACTSSTTASVQGALLTGNGSGLLVDGCSNATFADVTSVNNTAAGAGLTGATGNVVWNLVAVNNGGAGIELSGSAAQNLLQNLVAVNNDGFGVSLSGAPDNRLSGMLTVGLNVAGDCYVDMESTSGDLRDDAAGLDLVHEGLCAGTGEAVSDFALSTGASAAGSFVGKVGTDGTLDTSGDDVNPDDDWLPGLSNYNELTEYTAFEHAFRAWGVDGGAFPAADNRGPFGEEDTTRIWDFAASVADTGDGGGPVLWSVLPASDGNDVLVHTWDLVAAAPADCDAVPGSTWAGTDDCRSTFLRHAVEIATDGDGNDNGLCESGEACLYTPNVGAYQGHGTPQPAGAFSDGTVSGVTLIEYPSNGY